MSILTLGLVAGCLWYKLYYLIASDNSGRIRPCGSRAGVLGRMAADALEKKKVYDRAHMVQHSPVSLFTAADGDLAVVGRPVGSDGCSVLPDGGKPIVLAAAVRNPNAEIKS
ncbi:unnamed protein product [Polarella glacialis]|uniref:Uncharacterized protein n=2 Tax=Polarella glacialis TaxID=89957 RepID=A0A813D7L1_POLGL|nr:unnamed protein product [Polarella glacialis]